MRTLLVALVSIALPGCSGGGPGGGGTGAAGPSFPDPDVARIHARMMEAMAPDNGWERARYIQFDWVVSGADGQESRRAHRWDRYTGAYRLDAATQDGAPMVAVFDVGEPGAGRVWVDGALQPPEAAAPLLERANAIFINDSYWLLMPYKWADPGVNCAYLGPATDEAGREWEVVELTFDSVGLTPRNKYRAFVNPETGRMERWQHWRDADDPEPRFTSDWTDWRTYGPIQLSSLRPDPATGESRIRFENLRVEASVPADALAPPGA